jgi:hypothetical protein
MMGTRHTGHRSTAITRRALCTATVMIAATLAVPLAARASLPDGRVYEQVSPVLKDAFDAGAPNGAPRYSHATADGNGLLYPTRGPQGTVTRGLQEFTVGRRGAEGWSAVSALPAGSADRIFAPGHNPWSVLPSGDLTKLAFVSAATYVSDNPDTQNLLTSGALYLSDDSGAIDWLTRPQIPNPVPAPGSISSVSVFEPVGGSPDLSTLYFWSQPTLLSADAARAGGPGWGLYEYSDGVVKPAGTLPDGSEDPGGAAPAATGSSFRNTNNNNTPEAFGNQVSRDGSTLFFVSPDPGGDPGFGPMTQLYVRRGGHSKLVSHAADKSRAPSGAMPVAARNGPGGDPVAHEYAYASADGKTAIFQSLDALAPGAPNDGSLKAYRYDVGSDTVSYLPGVSGTVVAASDDGGRFLFGDEHHIAVWDHGVVKTIASDGGLQLAPARATASGSTFLFSTQAAIPGFNSGGFIQVYRYDVDQGKTTCLSCPQDGAVPSGDATLSHQASANALNGAGELLATREMSDDGTRVFLDTSDALVPRDTNGKVDVYEWTSNGLSLISSGRSKDDSFLLDTSASGNDVFFATAEGLDADDTDGAYDVYDARVGGGFQRADVAAPCTADTCQGGVSGAPTLAQPGSVTFSGAGNPESRRGASASPTAKLKLGSRSVRKGTLDLTVTIARTGRVTVTGDGLRAVSKSYAKTGTFKLAVPLTVTAKRSLKGHHRLKLSVRVGFTPRSGAASSVNFVLNAKA